MPFPSILIANNILQLAFRDDRHVCPPKLNRILWFTACEYAKTGRGPLLPEQFEPWSRGPVARSVHGKFGVFGAAPINVYGKDAAGKAHVVDLSRNSELSAVISEVWEKTSVYTPNVLSDVATWPGSAWWNATANKDRYITADAMAADTSYVKMLDLPASR